MKKRFNGSIILFVSKSKIRTESFNGRKIVKVSIENQTRLSEWQKKYNQIAAENAVIEQGQV